ncbi:hypothetical protein GCM10011390_29230 [Aureimonas endophytica]|uniref:Co-chaperone DjlA N-terminal domain-containing protein n=1 Tax=Aureimonas endophytica TaxID=2027858 RepID=A0A916ZPW4_9HYPH|nr:TerB family tellurite resistance protein [Aureimonas endophytica]GGE08313.1 hypothetical protein GCM10011390_29230 [Aureimonas endophytica]
MFEALKDFLRGLGFEDGGAMPSGRDPRVAAAALLCHVAEADGAVTEAELDLLRAGLSTEFGLAPAETETVLRAGRAADAEAVDLFQFTSVLLAALSAEERIRFVGLLWDVVYADGRVHELEDNTIWRIAELLGVSARERMLAKQAAAAEAPFPADADADG